MTIIEYHETAYSARFAAIVECAVRNAPAAFLVAVDLALLAWIIPMIVEALTL